MSNNGVVRVMPGLYRHFKGAYFYVTHIAHCSDNYNECDVIYFDVCRPHEGCFSRPLYDFIGDNDEYSTDDEGKHFAVGNPIKDRTDNVTGQFRRFERVLDLNFQLGSVSTEQLIEELRKRKDSPIHELDIEGLKSNIFATDYVIGIKHEATEDFPTGVDTINTFFHEEQALGAYQRTPKSDRVGLFKRTFIEVK